MKYICLGYFDEAKWKTVPEEERESLMDACFAYDAVLREGGHMVGGEALQSGETTLRYEGGKVTVTDGPFAETREQLGGLLVLEARDMNHAIALMSKHPGVRIGPFVIRATDPEMETKYEEWERER